MTNLSDNYKAAIAAHNAACNLYFAVVTKFRAGEADYDEFAVASKAKATADAAFDVAFDEESNRPEEAEAEAEDTQFNLI